jgi:hypothetical protein
MLSVFLNGYMHAKQIASVAIDNESKTEFKKVLLREIPIASAWRYSGFSSFWLCFMTLNNS